jgi:hypothetical protein
MSDYVDRDMQDATFDLDIEDVDWAQLQEEVMKAPWFQFDDFDWSACDQGVDAEASLPGDG